MSTRAGRSPTSKSTLPGSSAVPTPAAQLREILGVSLPDEFCELALTHRSYAYEHGGLPTNERLEFLGDSVLGQAVTVKLYQDFPELDEGDLAKRRASLVSTVALAHIARGLGIGTFIRLGRGEALSGGDDKDSILADTMEALIGASYLACGQEAASALVLRLIGPLIEHSDQAGALVDPKTALQEHAAHHGLQPPRYRLSESGPDHNKLYLAQVSVGSVTGHGEGTSKKHAEMAAARDAWTQFSDDETPA